MSHKVDHLLIIHYLMRHRRMTLQDAQEICYQRPERVMDEIMTELERIEVVKSIEPTHKQSTALFYKVLQALYLK